MNSAIASRDGQLVTYKVDEFWSPRFSEPLQRSDQIFDWADRQVLYPGQFPNVEPYLPPRSIDEIIEDVLTGAFAVGAGLVLAAGAIMLVESIFGTPKPAR
ncbi:MAG TPA: hypothetical protein VGO47_09935 [Chlamydiales bacterium]|jgi:hypothetical protein|nr:hypothetical protein [Chlamydiales bacterium]